MNDFLKINEIIDLLKVNEKNEINQFKKQNIKIFTKNIDLLENNKNSKSSVT